MLSQEIKNNPPRQLPDGVDEGQPPAIEKLANALQLWIKKQAVEEVIQEDGTVKTTMGFSTKERLERLKQGDKSVISQIKIEGKAENLYQADNFDLIVWMVVHTEI